MTITAEEIRKIALALPETTEKIAWGKPTFRVRDRIFASFDDDALGFYVSREERGELIAAEPEKFFHQSGHDDNYNWCRLRLAAVDVTELREILTDAWLARAPRSLAKAFDQG